MLVGVNDDAEIHAVDGGVAIGDMDFSLEVFRRQRIGGSTASRDLFELGRGRKREYG